MGKIGHGTKRQRFKRLAVRLDRQALDFANLFADAMTNKKPCPRCLDSLNGVAGSRHCGNCECCKGTPK